MGAKYKLLLHCKIPQIREGFEANLNSLPFPCTARYADLSHEGIQSKLQFLPDLIIVLFHEGDSDLTLPLKLKLFASDIPLLLVIPAVPAQYRSVLRRIGIRHVLELPADSDKIMKTICELLKWPHGKP